jgi:hypothetical protein
MSAFHESQLKRQSHEVSNTLAALAMALFLLAPARVYASSHREAPITALDHAADVTDWYAFASYDHPGRVTMILNVEPLLEPTGPTIFHSIRMSCTK